MYTITLAMDVEKRERLLHKIVSLLAPLLGGRRLGPIVISASNVNHELERIRPHIGHTDFLEVVTYGEQMAGKPWNVCVECAKCGCVVAELYDVGWESLGGW